MFKFVVGANSPHRTEFKSTVNFEHIKGHYYTSHKQINPNGIVAVGPDLALFDRPHHRDEIGKN